MKNKKNHYVIDGFKESKVISGTVDTGNFVHERKIRSKISNDFNKLQEKQERFSDNQLNKHFWEDGRYSK